MAYGHTVLRCRYIVLFHEFAYLGTMYTCAPGIVCEMYSKYTACCCSCCCCRECIYTAVVAVADVSAAACSYRPSSYTCHPRCSSHSSSSSSAYRQLFFIPNARPLPYTPLRYPERTSSTVHPSAVRLLLCGFCSAMTDYTSLRHYGHARSPTCIYTAVYTVHIYTHTP